MGAGGCLVAVVQWQSTGGTSQVSWVQLLVAAGLFQFPAFSPHNIYFQLEARCSEYFLSNSNLAIKALLMGCPCLNAAEEVHMHFIDTSDIHAATKHPHS